MQEGGEFFETQRAQCAQGKSEGRDNGHREHGGCRGTSGRRGNRLHDHQGFRRKAGTESGQGSPCGDQGFQRHDRHRLATDTEIVEKRGPARGPLFSALKCFIRPFENSVKGAAITELLPFALVPLRDGGEKADDARVDFTAGSPAVFHLMPGSFPGRSRTSQGRTSTLSPRASRIFRKPSNLDGGKEDLSP